MIPSVLARQLERGGRDYLATTFPILNEPFKSAFAKFSSSDGGLYLEPYTAIKLPFRTASDFPEDFFKAVHPKFTPYVHQKRAFERLTGDDGRSTLISTGTGSGKTECFLYPILEYCWNHRGERGIKALIIYPMNALATDQAGRIAKLIWDSPELKNNVSVGLYVGGLGHAGGSSIMSENGVITKRDTMLSNPPDILLTNYKMLDYLLVRPERAGIWGHSDVMGAMLRYVAVDELHTFDGAQGTDLACLLRRLKSRLHVQRGDLCCIGTSATMGDASSTAGMRKYASDIFGEDFDEDSVITEDRLAVDEFLANHGITGDATFDRSDERALTEAAAANDLDAYLRRALECCLPDLAGSDSEDPSVRLSIGMHLMGNTLFRDVLRESQGHYFQSSEMAERLVSRHAWLEDLDDKSAAIDAIVALVSQARGGTTQHPTPFLNVQTQLWMRELARTLAEVTPDEPRFDIAINLNESQRGHYLPLYNCRDCGQTGWVATIGKDQKLRANNLNAFYNEYFGQGAGLVVVYPYEEGREKPGKLMEGGLCPECLNLRLHHEGTPWDDTLHCDDCGTDRIRVWVAELEPSTRAGSASRNSRQYSCPCCGSTRGSSLVGLRSTSEAEVALTQLFASQFDDDNKSLVFSDNVQDASHRAGFFNGRAWRFGLRSAMTEYLMEEGDGKTIAEFARGYVRYFEDRMTKEEFVSRFLAPNNLWMRDYEDMIESGKLADTEGARKLLANVRERMEYEVLLELGMRRGVGRTLEKCGVASVTYPKTLVEKATSEASELMENELGMTADATRTTSLVLGFLDEMRTQGAIADGLYEGFVNSGANFYYISHDYRKSMPGAFEGTTPVFLLDSAAPRKGFNSSSSEYFTRIASRYLGALIDGASAIACVTKACLDAGLLERIGEGRYACVGLSQQNMIVTGNVRRLACRTCGSSVVVVDDNVHMSDSTPCLHLGCNGILELADKQGPDYYGRLFGRGLTERIRAQEHTGLLTREEREQVEHDFKATGESQRPWYPNVLSCTPTLEMGIDIGDLSTLVLCGMPPGQAQFLQRVGRAGRRDGNALAVVLANANAHGMYFYADPAEMMEGNVEPPHVFLHAAAVLERQFLAFCMDKWIEQKGDQAVVPERIFPCLQIMAHGKEEGSKFPFNFLNFVGSRKNRLYNMFIQMLDADLKGDRDTKDAIYRYANGVGEHDGAGGLPSLQWRMWHAFENRYLLRESFKQQKAELDSQIKALEAKPADSSFTEQIKELTEERDTITGVIKGINNEDVFGFMSREGLLPNYAFPEDGISLRTIVRRRKEDAAAGGRRPGKWEYFTKEFSRSAAAGISDFAPGNMFYATSRHFRVDQVDLATSSTERWRFCPNCSHAERVTPSTPKATCPKCGYPGWADAGQEVDMLRLKTVISNADDVRSRSDDSSDRRTKEFFSRQLLVEVDETHDIESAYQVTGEKLDFAYEYANKASLREVNFGQERETGGRESVIAGDSRIRPGFRICKKCGRVEHIQRGKATIDHAITCPVRKGAEREEDNIIDCLFLYREFESEAFRILIPETTFVSDEEAIVETFTAAVMLGLKKKFGNVDHLQTTISDEPIAGSGYRKRYLVIYDSVPGGTGYLKQLASDKDAFLDVLREAKRALDECPCNEDPSKDGCYHCLYAYRQSKNIGSISRRRAQEVLGRILDPSNEVKKVDTIAHVDVNHLLDSELEQRFVDALATVRIPGETTQVTNELINNKPGYMLAVGNIEWEVEPQVLLGPSEGVSVKCKPDFILRPTGVGMSDSWRNIAIFTDGFEYHKDEVPDDTLKREAVRRAGYRVWSLTWKDVEGAIKHSNDGYLANLLDPTALPGESLYNRVLAGTAGTSLAPHKLTPFGLLAWYLTHANAEKALGAQAKAYTAGTLGKGRGTLGTWLNDVSAAADQLDIDLSDFVPGSAIANEWVPSDTEYLRVLTGAKRADLAKGSATLALLQIDDSGHGSPSFQREWNGFWAFANLLQFFPGFYALATGGISDGIYYSLNNGNGEAAAQKPVKSGPWDGIAAQGLLSKEAEDFLPRFVSLGVPVPDSDDIGYELEGGEIAEIAWPSYKVCYLTSEQAEDKAAFRSEGWAVIDTKSNDAEIVAAFRKE